VDFRIDDPPDLSGARFPSDEPQDAVRIGEQREAAVADAVPRL
jgi:hypothetical protein